MLSLSNRQRTDIVKAFCSEIENAGYSDNNTIIKSKNAIKDIIRHNERAYVQEITTKEPIIPIKLSDTIVDVEKRKTVADIDYLINQIANSSKEEAIEAYNKLMEIINDKKANAYKNLTPSQTYIIKTIYLKVAKFIYDNKINVKVYQKIA